jgi:hypothetical protein
MLRVQGRLRCSRCTINHASLPALHACRDVTVVAEGTPSSSAFDIIKDKKEDNVVACNAEGNFVGALA